MKHNRKGKHQITEAEYQAVCEFAKKNQDKRIERRLRVLMLRYEGLRDKEIAEVLNYSTVRISELCKEFKTIGLEEYVKSKYKGNHRNLSQEDEKEILSVFYEKAANGEEVTARMIREKLEEKLGRKTSDKYVYDVLKRQGWKNIPSLRDHKRKKQAKIDH